MRCLWWLATLSVLAGCADGAPPAVDEEEEQFDDLDTTATATTGVIRGLVLDPAIVPIEGATVAIKSLSVETMTNEGGAFAFQDLEPGSYFLSVSRVGYSKVQTTATVEAGVDRPPIVKVQLEPDSSSIPVAELLQYEGYLQCGVGLGVAAASTNPCAFTGSVNTFNTPVAKPVNATQIEMVWEGTNVFGDGLDVGILRPGTLGNFVGSDGPSPRILPITQQQMESGLGPSYESYLIRVFPGTNQPVSVVVEQRFTIYTTNFYGMVPDEGWAFIVDGPHPIPR